jgi:hypothetical protein
MNKYNKIDEFCKLLTQNNVRENDIKHFKANAKKYKLQKKEFFILKDTNTLNHTGKVYQIWTTLNKGHTANEYICSVGGIGNKRIFLS